MEQNNNEIQNNIDTNLETQTNQNVQQTTVINETVTNTVQSTEPVQPENKNETLQKKDNSKIIIIAVVAVALIIGIVVFLLVGKKEPSNPQQPNDPAQVSEIKKIVHSIDNENYLVEIKNNKSTVVDFKVKMNIFDENKNVINSIDKNIKSLGIGESTYILLNHQGNADKEYEVLIEDENNSDSNKVFTKQLELNHKKEDKDISFTLKNNSTSTVNIIEIEVIYYKNDKIIKYSELAYKDLETTQMIGDTIYTPTNDSGEKIDFDKYEITFRAYN